MCTDSGLESIVALKCYVTKATKHVHSSQLIDQAYIGKQLTPRQAANYIITGNKGHKYVCSRFMHLCNGKVCIRN